MAYTLTNWQDAPSNATPLSSADLLLYNTAINDIDNRINAKQPALTATAVKTSAYSAAANQFVPVNTTSGPVTVTFPTAPADGTRVGAEHVIQGGSNTVTLQLGGADKFNTTTGPTTATLSTVNQGAVYLYSAATAVWLLVAQIGTSGTSVSSVTAGNSTITIGGTAANPTVAVNAITESQVTNLTTDLASKAATASPTFTGTATFAKMVQAPVNLTDAATIAVDASLGNTYRVTLGGNRTVAAPTNATNGQMIIFEIIQDATGSRTITWTGGAGGYAFGTDVTTPTLTTTANKRDFVGFYYNSTSNLWYCLAWARGY